MNCEEIARFERREEERREEKKRLTTDYTDFTDLERWRQCLPPWSSGRQGRAEAAHSFVRFHPTYPPKPKSR
jgi:hypothetical protein